MRYRDFELLVGEKRPGGYHARVIDSPAGQADGVLAIDPDASSVRQALARLERHDTNEAFLKSFGESLFEKLFSHGIRDLFQHSLGQVRTEGTGLRMRLRIEPPAISALPWEYLYDPEENFFLATSPEILISRYIQVARPLVPLLVDLPLRILLVISSPSDLPQLNVEEEEAHMRSALTPLIEGQQVELDVLRVATRQRIQSGLQDKEYHVFHFIGHGDFRRDEGYLALVDKDSGQSYLMDAEDFSTFFLHYRPMRLILLNACKTAQTGTEEAFVGMAPHLVRRGIPAIIAMRYSIPDPTAILFSEEFYKSLAKGYPADTAVSQARRAILLDIGRGERDFGIPILFMRAEDGRIIDFPSQKEERITGGAEQAVRKIEELFKQYASREGAVALSSLIESLKEFGEMHDILRQWNELNRLLRNLESSFSSVSAEPERLRRERRTEVDMDVARVQDAWERTRDRAFNQVLAFAERVRDDQGEALLGELKKTGQEIDENLRRRRLVDLCESIEEFKRQLAQYRAYGDERISDTITYLGNLSTKLMERISNW